MVIARPMPLAAPVTITALLAEAMFVSSGIAIGGKRPWSGGTCPEPWDAGVKRARTVLQQLKLEGLRRKLDAMVPLVRQVMKQTRARIFRGDTRSEGKLLSLFEPSTEVIRKGKAAKPNEFGKMVKLQEAENQIVIEYEVY